MIVPTVMNDSVANEILGGLGCKIHILQQGDVGGHMDNWGEYITPLFKIYKAVTIAGDRRTAISKLQAEMAADKADNVSVFYRTQTGSEAAIESPDTGPETYFEIAVAFSSEANDVAELAKQPKAGDTGVSFGAVLEALENGYRAAREGWNGKGMFVYLVPGSEFEVNRAPLLGIFDAGRQIEFRPHIDMFTADGQVVVWTISQSDALAKDWVILPRKLEA